VGFRGVGIRGNIVLLLSDIKSLYSVDANQQQRYNVLAAGDRE
jgi:hypothetical protein